jgi:hypothetical protein
MHTKHQDMRSLDGSIVYRPRVLMERRIVMTGFFKGFGKLVKPLVAVALIAAAVCASPSRDGTGWVAPTARVSLAHPTTAAQLYALNAAR